MDARFDTILVPVDFSAATDGAVEMALELSDSKSTLHLLHVQIRAVGLFKNRDNEHHTALMDIKNKIHEKKPSLQVNLALAQDASVKKAIINKAVETETDLIILSRNYKASWPAFFSPALPVQLAKEAPCAVLTAAPNVVCGAAKTVIVPLIGEATYNKMGVIAALANNRKLDVHLVAFTGAGDNSPESAPSSLLRIYRWLKTALRCQVQYKVLPARNKAEATLTYAGSVNADIILIDPEAQTETEWWGRHASTFLQSKSAISVLAVHSAGPLISH